MDIQKIIKWLSDLLSKLFRSIKSFFNVTKKVQKGVQVPAAAAPPKAEAVAPPKAEAVAPPKADPSAVMGPPAPTLDSAASPLLGPYRPTVMGAPSKKFSSTAGSDNLDNLIQEIIKSRQARETAFAKNNPVAASFRRLATEPAIEGAERNTWPSVWGLFPSPYSLARKVLPERVQRKLGIVPYLKGEPDLKQDSPFLNDPGATAVGLGLPASSGFWQLVRRRGAKAAFKATAKSLKNTAAPVGKGFLVFETVRRNLPAIKHLMANTIFNKGEVSLGKAVRDFGKDVSDIGAARLKGNPYYEEALTGAAKDPLDSLRMWRQWLIDSAVDEGTLFNTTLRMAEDTSRAARGLNAAKNQLADVTNNNALLAGWAAANSSSDIDPMLAATASRAGTRDRLIAPNYPGVQPNSIAGPGEGYIIRYFADPASKFHITSTRRAPANTKIPVGPINYKPVDRAALDAKIHKLTYGQKDTLERLSRHYIPDSPSQYSARSNAEGDKWLRANPNLAAEAAKQNKDLQRQRNAWIRANYKPNGSKF